MIRDDSFKYLPKPFQIFKCYICVSNITIITKCPLIGKPEYIESKNFTILSFPVRPLKTTYFYLLFHPFNV